MLLRLPLFARNIGKLPVFLPSQRYHCYYDHGYTSLTFTPNQDLLRACESVPQLGSSPCGRAGFTTQAQD